MEKQYIEINAFINDLKSDKRYLMKCDPLYVAVVNETEKNIRAWAASEEAEDIEKIIHCKDCRFYEPIGNGVQGFCEKLYILGVRQNSDFCSEAERPLPPYDDHDVSGLLDD